MLLFFFFAAVASTSVASSSIIKSATIDGQQYSCRPSSIEPKCNLKSDFGFLATIGAATADATLCLNDVGNDRSKIKDCFLQRRIKNYAEALDIQMISRACWGIFLSKCTEISVCPPPSHRDKSCGYLGSFLTSVREAALDNVFTENDGVNLCHSLIQ